ncbi:MAG TPA: hypothetical protein VFS35_02000 [Terrimicrobiaceae bacterium]|nr:hypothetical protein [Terrimicrobiaceae bacterium]HEU4678262.1 hypothetical protein [Terrimicrobiaceae bacterium]
MKIPELTDLTAIEMEDIQGGRVIEAPRPRRPLLLLLLLLLRLVGGGPTRPPTQL